MSRRTPAAFNQAARADRRGLIAALVVDNAGSGLFLPLTLVFLVRVVGVSVGSAGTLLATGTLVGLCAPAMVGRISDRISARSVVAASMLIQGAGMGCYLIAHVPGTAVLAAALVAAGTQTFYSALFALISDVAGEGPKDHAFAAVDMARAAAFGGGSLVAALLLSVASSAALRIAVAVDAASFVAGAALLCSLVAPAGTATRRDVGRRVLPDGDIRRLRRDRPFLVLIVTVTALALVTDVFLVGLPVYALTALHTAAWVPGVCLALSTAATSTLGGLAVRRLARVRRTTALGIGAGCMVVWCVLVAAAAAVPRGWAGVWLVASTAVLIAGALAAGTRANAIAEAAAPAELRGRYLATFQYAFTIAGLLAPLVVGLFGVATWLPWLVVAGAAALGAAALPWLNRALPSRAIRPIGPVHGDDVRGGLRTG